MTIQSQKQLLIVHPNETIEILVPGTENLLPHRRLVAIQEPLQLRKTIIPTIMILMKEIATMLLHNTLMLYDCQILILRHKVLPMETLLVLQQNKVGFYKCLYVL